MTGKDSSQGGTAGFTATLRGNKACTRSLLHTALACSIASYVSVAAGLMRRASLPPTCQAYGHLRMSKQRYGVESHLTARACVALHAAACSSELFGGSSVEQ